MTDTQSAPSGERTGSDVPVDLCALVGFVIVAVTGLTVVDVSDTVARAALGGPLLLLAPGYALVAFLFPGGEDPALIETSGLTDGERLALAFGSSIALLPLIGLPILQLASPSPTTVVAAVAGSTLTLAVLAGARWYALVPTDRYQFQPGVRLGSWGQTRSSRSRTNAAVSLLLAGSVLVAFLSVGYALAAPQHGESTTELFLLTEEDDDLVAANVSATLEPDESIPLTLALENQEGEPREYTAIVQEQWVDDDGAVRERTDLEEHSYELADGETVTDDLEIEPDAEAGTVRLAVMLYADEVPETPTFEDAYRHGYVWTEIGEEFE